MTPASGYGLGPGQKFLLVSLVTLGGGNFSSSMSNINYFFPQRRKGWALGLNAGGGNIGVAVVQLAGLAVIAQTGVTHPSYLPLLYLPLILIAGVDALRRMDNLTAARADLSAQQAAVPHRDFWPVSLLYIGTFGSFIGYSFAFGLVLVAQFGRTPLGAAALTFIGPLAGSLSRPAGGWLSGRLGAARVTLWNFAGMAACAGLLLMAGAQQSFGLFQARRVSSAMLGIVGAAGALGGVLINLAFRASFSSAARSAGPALIAFLFFYAVCFAVTWLRSARRPAAARSEVLAYLLGQELTGRRVAVQLHGEPLPDFVQALRAAGACVVEVPVYRWAPPDDTALLGRLVEAVASHAVDAVTFTSAPAAASLLRAADGAGLLPDLVDAFRRRVLAACVGPVTAAPLDRLDVPSMQPARARLGALVRELCLTLPGRVRRLPVAGHVLEVRGHAAVVDGLLRPLAPAPAAALRLLAEQPGRVCSRAELLAVLPGQSAGEHAVEMTVNRLRTALEASLVQTIVKRGYRLACEPENAGPGCLARPGPA